MNSTVFKRLGTSNPIIPIPASENLKIERPKLPCKYWGVLAVMDSWRNLGQKMTTIYLQISKSSFLEIRNTANRLTIWSMCKTQMLGTPQLLKTCFPNLTNLMSKKFTEIKFSHKSLYNLEMPLTYVPNLMTSNLFWNLDLLGVSQNPVTPHQMPDTICARVTDFQTWMLNCPKFPGKWGSPQ